MNKLSTKTLNTLRNFASINKNLLVKPGSEISTLSEAKNIFATAKVDEVFEKEFGIYDLTEFLGAYNLFEDPDISFQDEYVTLSAGRSKVDYRFADESILTYPTKKITMPPSDVEVTITEEILKQITKAASTFGNTVASIRNKNGNIVLSVIDPKNSSSNVYSITLEEKTDNEDSFDLQFLISNIKVIPGSYKVSISRKLISHWAHDTDPIEYYIALEKTSSYDS